MSSPAPISKDCPLSVLVAWPRGSTNCETDTTREALG